MNITGQKVRIREVGPDDFTRVAAWRQDEEITALDIAAGNVFNTQVYSIETLGKVHIGTCSLYNHAPTEIQLGIMIGDKDYWNKGYGTDTVSLLTSYALATLSIERVWLKVLPLNKRAIRCYEKCGFSCSGRLALNGYEFITMEIRKQGL